MLRFATLFAWSLVGFALHSVPGAAAPGALSAQQVATQLYPGHRILQLSPSRTSSIQAAVQAARSASQSPVLVLLYPAASTVTASAALVVDNALSVGEGQSLVIATPAALQAAAAAVDGAGPSRRPLPASDLLPVRCRGSKDSFLQAKGAESVELLGLAIEGCPATAVVAMSTSRVILQDVALTNNNKVAKAENGGALQAESVASVVLSRVVCSGNFALVKGGCVSALRVGQVMVADSRFTGNQKNDPDTEGGGGAISVEITQKLSVTRSEFSNNIALGSRNKGGAIRGFLSGPIEVTHSSFTNNGAEANGGAIQGGDVAAVTITNCTFIGNGPTPATKGGPAGKPSYGGAVDVVGNRYSGSNPVRLAIRDCIFEGNTAESGGGVSSTQWGPFAGIAEIYNSVFKNNTADDGGAIFNVECRVMQHRIHNSVFVGNSAGQGGAFSLYDSNAVLSNCSFADNKATDGDGGAINLHSGTSTGTPNSVTLTGVRLVRNTAAGSAGAMKVFGSRSLTVQDLEVADNSAGASCGAVAVGSVPTVQFSRTTITNNTSGDGSGGLEISEAAVVTMQGITIQGNTGAQGGGLALHSVATAALSSLTVRFNFASQAGGGMAVMGGGAVTLADSSLSSNRAPLGGALVADSCRLQLQRVNFTANTAAPAGKETSSPVVLQFESLMHVQGSAGAALIQRSTLNLSESLLTGNSAEWDAGALMLQQPERCSMDADEFTQNSVKRGVGGAIVLRGVGARAEGSLKSCSFTDNAALLGSGGAIVLDSGLGPLEVQFEGCNFSRNAAGQDGGAVAATGPTDIYCSGCMSERNNASRSGGWLACSGCQNTQLTDCSSMSNTAAAGAGGSVSCTGCASVTVRGDSYSSNAAVAGGAVALQSTAAVDVSGCSFDSNSAAAAAPGLAAAATAAAIGSRGRRARLATKMPAGWQVLFGAGAGGGELGCNTAGSGGGLCVADATHAVLADTRLSDNIGRTGGAVFASATCTGQQPTAETTTNSSAAGGSCAVRLVNISATGNEATEAGGALYTSTPQAVQLAESHGDSSTAGRMNQDAQAVLQQLQHDNTAANGSYGSGAASSPVRLAFMQPADDTGPPPCGNCSGSSGSSSGGSGGQAANNDAIHDSQQQEQGHDGSHPAGRKLLYGGSYGGGAFSSSLASSSEYAMRAGGDSSEGAGLPPTCPPLGATVLNGQQVGVDAYSIFSLPVYIVDAFGSRVSRGPGSDWMATLEPEAARRGGSGGEASLPVQLSGAARGRLAAGAVLLDGLTVAATPGSELQMRMTARPEQGAPGQAVSTNVAVKVRPCLPGQSAGFSNTTGTDAQTCYICAAPLFSFSAYASSASTSNNASATGSSAGTGACQSCPNGGICVAGMVIPSQGTYQAHPRTRTILSCPHRKACLRSMAAMQNLQGLQCDYRRFVDPSDINPEPYRALQCSGGYAGPFCSGCYRSGRNAWLAGQQLEQQQLEQQQGYSVAGKGTALAAPLSELHASEVYGRSNGRCQRCPHIALAWVGFLLSRVLDLVFVGMLAWLWLILGWLSGSPAANALKRLKQERAQEVKFRSATSIGGFADGMKTLMSVRSTTSLVSKPSLATGRLSGEIRLQPSVSGLLPSHASGQLSGLPAVGSVTLKHGNGCSSMPQPMMLGHGNGCSSMPQPMMLGHGNGCSSMPQPAAREALGVTGGTAAAAAEAPTGTAAGQGSSWRRPPVALTRCCSLAEGAAPAAASADSRQGVVSHRPAQRSRSLEELLVAPRVPSTRFHSVIGDVIIEGTPAVHDAGTPTPLPPAAAAAAATGGAAAEAAKADDAVDDAAAAVSPFELTTSHSAFAADADHPVGSQHRRHSSSSRSGGYRPEVLGNMLLSNETPAEVLSSQLNGMDSSYEPFSNTGLVQQSSAFYALYRPASATWASVVNICQQMSVRAALGAAGAAAVGVGEAVDTSMEARAAQKVALLLMAVRYLACLAQVVLDCAQLAAVVLAQDMLWRVPDWAAAGMSAVLITQQTTWQWVPFDCLIPGYSAASGAVLQSILVLLLPVLYTASLLPLMIAVKKAVKHSAGMQLYADTELQSVTASMDSSTAGSVVMPVGWGGVKVSPAPSILSPTSGSTRGTPTQSTPGASPLLTPVSSLRHLAHGSGLSTCASGVLPAAQDDQLTQQQQQQPCVQGQETGLSGSSSQQLQQQQQQQQPRAKVRCWWPKVWSLRRNTWVLLTSLAVASMAYTYSFYAATVVGAFSCMRLAAKPALPGEVLLHGTVWVSDMQLQCWSGPHVAVVAFAVLLGVPMLLGYWWVLLVLAWPQPGGHHPLVWGDLGASEPDRVEIHASKRRSRRRRDKHAASASGSGKDVAADPGAAAADTACARDDSATSIGVATMQQQQQQQTGLAATSSTPIPAAAAAAAPADLVAVPTVEAGPAAAASQPAALALPRRMCDACKRVLARMGQAFMACCAVPVQYIKLSQHRLGSAGISGMRCAALGVWEMRWRWYWLPSRELIKFAVVLIATINSMRAPNAQALLVLLFVVLGAGLTWQAQPASCTSMARLLFVGWLWVQGLALLVLLLALPNLDGAAFGGALLGLLVVGCLQIIVVLAGLVLRCLTAAKAVRDSTAEVQADAELEPLAE